MSQLRTIVEVQNLTKVYHKGPYAVPVLKGVTFSVTAGTRLAVMGPSGSGKSTLLNILGCLDTPTSGRYVLDGLEVSSLKEDQLAEVRSHKIGFVFQTFHLLPGMSALENVELPLIYAGVPRRLRRELARKALDLVSLSHRIAHYPNELSGGESQRVAIARAIINEPALLLADEPTGNLDSRVGKEIMALFLSLNEQLRMTLILVTHDPKIASYADYTLFMHDGKLQEGD